MAWASGCTARKSNNSVRMIDSDEADLRRRNHAGCGSSVRWTSADHETRNNTAKMQKAAKDDADGTSRRFGDEAIFIWRDRRIDHPERVIVSHLRKT